MENGRELLIFAGASRGELKNLRIHLSHEPLLCIPYRLEKILLWLAGTMRAAAAARGRRNTKRIGCPDSGNSLDAVEAPVANEVLDVPHVGQAGLDQGRQDCLRSPGQPLAAAHEKVIVAGQQFQSQVEVVLRQQHGRFQQLQALLPCPHLRERLSAGDQPLELLFGRDILALLVVFVQQ